ncbi:UDP-glucose 6-dehydrogenase [Bacillus sp. LL01]|uniref:UDP-glucose 6-dehydrogenase TuaD n=1 Tax=Bacillus sp. LL01 TaxID=1665556 RepID=UPI00064D4E8D|nr:UDP-glucose/GDP-mannose dehydrogenase family protein [Bacillus sp. LL01]KMJ59015.1 UDP-glucose 6-dehydrogenase [Bacillus sp. LL01]
MKRIAVVGTGYVGLVSGTCFSEIGNRVICCDIDDQKINNLKNGIIPIYEPGLEDLVKKNVENGNLSFTTDIADAIKDSEIIYIAVGTPMADTGEANLTYVDAVAKTIGENLNSYKVVVNKSTVPVGTGKRVSKIINEVSGGNQEFDVVSNPEFLREGSAIEDTMNMERAVIGASSEKAASIIEELHSPFNTIILKSDLESAEMIKYASNAFLATKISFINDIANICEEIGADVTKVAEGMGLDSRIGKKFLNAGIGYGGSCFPKDTSALLHIANSVGYDFKLIRAVMETNDFQKSRVVQKVMDIFGEIEGKTFAVMGLAFKPNTDDMRDAPSLEIIPELLKAGAKVKAFDSIAITEAKKHFGDSIDYFEHEYEALNDADACIIVTDLPEVKELDLQKMKECLKNPIVIDGRNIFDLNEVKKYSIIYHSIGRPVIN